MFRWFKRRMATPSRAQPGASAHERTQAAPHTGAAEFGDSLALPEVVNEGNSPADWRMWEDSMTALDSRMQGLTPSRI